MIRYLSAGRLGDFIHSLSVINEKFLQTGKKGVLFICNENDSFREGVEKAYNDTKKLVEEQEYIESYSIYLGEPYDIDLRTWRRDPILAKTFQQHFSDEYSISWGKNRWLNVPVDKKWQDTVFIFTVDHRSNILNFRSIVNKYGDRCVYIGQDIKFYQHFNSCTKISLPVYIVKDLYEFCVCINSCRLFISSISAPLAIANALHHEVLAGLEGYAPYDGLHLGHKIPGLHFSIDQVDIL